MNLLTVILQVLLFLIVEFIAHTISWNVQKRVRISLWKSMILFAIVLVSLFHAIINPWIWVSATAFCLGITHGILEANRPRHGG